MLVEDLKGTTNALKTGAIPKDRIKSEKLKTLLQVSQFRRDCTATADLNDKGFSLNAMDRNQIKETVKEYSNRGANRYQSTYIRISFPATERERIVSEIMAILAAAANRERLL